MGVLRGQIYPYVNLCFVDKSREFFKGFKEGEGYFLKNIVSSDIHSYNNQCRWCLEIFSKFRFQYEANLSELINLYSRWNYQITYAFSDDFMQKRS